MVGFPAQRWRTTDAHVLHTREKGLIGPLASLVNTDQCKLFPAWADIGV